MRPYGSDRVRMRDDGAIVLICRLAKEGWTARVPNTLTRSEHPGTAILWDEAYYEVVDINVIANGVEYTLTPWSESHTMRVSDAYDAKSEAKRTADRADVARRVKGRRAATLFGFFTGHLPASVQEQLAHETGANPPLLTIFSTLPEFAIAIYCILRIVSGRMGDAPAPPFWFVLLSGYFLLDAMIRGGFAFLNGRPLGSIFGIIGYAIYYAISPNRAKRIAPLSAPRGEGTFQIDVSDDVKLLDSIKMREPIFTLLSASEQRRLAERWDYDHRRSAASIAWGILIFSVLGVVTSLQTLRATPRFSALLSLASAGYLAIEQIVRLTQLNDRPVGSILGIIVRPFARKFL